MQLLIADDNEINLRVACAYLKNLGIPAESITTACNGVEATDKCLSQQYDMIFMDIQMPEMDGLAATRKIINENLQLTPRIVAITANTAVDSASEYMAAGMLMVLHKPINKAGFESALALIGDGI